VLAEKVDQAHLIEAMDEVMCRLDGTKLNRPHLAHRPPRHGHHSRQP
jgi:hypothetical protein